MSVCHLTMINVTQESQPQLKNEEVHAYAYGMNNFREGTLHPCQ